eukprot:TRINITY_DN24014_c0_g1_i1.p1 TRINITY_DN24014_c0_g1~~TRINITY_DN24014_c0_g1_i1.p1  ORF type:complete len:413 (+),score=49.33 TRINITY_DN24014_c0_g1_i1:54-1241(+)
MQDGREAVTTKRWYYYKGPVSSTDSWSRQCCLFAGSTHPQLAQEVAGYLGVSLSPANLGQYADSEVFVEVLDTVRGRDVFVLQSVCRSHPLGSVNDAFMELLLFISALRRSSARSITAVLPYYGYARSDRRFRGRYPIGAADVARALTSASIDRVISLDLHSRQIEGFFPPSVPVDNLTAGPVAACYFAELGLDDAVAVSPDAGGVTRAKEFSTVLTNVASKLQKRSDADLREQPWVDSQDLGANKLAIFVKQRSGASQIDRMDLIGSVANQDVILVDDIVDTAGSLCTAAAECKRHGARTVRAFCTHGLFSGSAPRLLAEACAAGDLDELLITNTVPQLQWSEWKEACGHLPPPRMKVLSIGAMLAEAIKRIAQNERLNLTNMVAHVVEQLSKL